MLNKYPIRGLHGRVVHELGLRIVSGALEVGEQLPPEAELSEVLDVSRSVLREAVKVLVAKGLVEIRPRTGTRVLPIERWHIMDPDVLGWRYEANPTLNELRDLMTLREIIEPAATGLAAKHRTQGELALIESAYLSMTEAAPGSDQFVAADLDFHNAIFDASGSQLLNHLNRAVSKAMSHIRPLHSSDPSQSEQTMRQHKLILDSIETRRAETAQDAALILVRGAR